MLFDCDETFVKKVALKWSCSLHFNNDNLIFAKAPYIENKKNIFKTKKFIFWIELAVLKKKKSKFKKKKKKKK